MKKIILGCALSLIIGIVSGVLMTVNFVKIGITSDLECMSGFSYTYKITEIRGDSRTVLGINGKGIDIYTIFDPFNRYI